MDVTREIYWNVSNWQKIFMYLTMLVVIVFATALITKKITLWRKAGGGMGRPQWPNSYVWALKQICGQRRILQDKVIGSVHLMIFYGTIVLLFGTITLTLDHYSGFDFLFGRVYLGYSFILDLAGLVLLTGVSIALVRRYLLRPQHVENRPEDALILLSLLVIILTGFLIEAMRISLTKPEFEQWSFVGYQMAGLFTLLGLNASLISYQAVWIIHVLSVAVFIVGIGTTKLSHMIMVGINYVVKSSAKLGELSGMSEEGGALPDPLKGLNWIQMLAADACTRCGRCNKVCPSVEAKTNLEPRAIVDILRKSLELSGSTENHIDTTGTTWACITCMACYNTCPVMVNAADVAVGMRRQLVEIGEVPLSAARMLENVQTYGNTYGSNSRRLAWAKASKLKEGELPSDTWLVWTGCVSAFDVVAQEGIKSLLQIMELNAVDYILLGKEEKCCGDPVRRIGEEGLFLELVEKNIATFNLYGITKIVTSCPHCLNVLKNDYAKLGFTGEVVHHSQLLLRLLESEQVKLNPSGGRLAFHDPCYLGRANGIFEDPRKVLDHYAKNGKVELLELPRNKSNSFCCGGGGGQLWLDATGERRPADLRVEEAVNIGVDILVTGCPFCKIMLSNANLKPQSQIQVFDLAQLVLQSYGDKPEVIQGGDKGAAL